MSSETNQLHNASSSSRTATYHQITARNFGEFGTILLPYPATFGSGRLLIDSTFGVYGYYWTHIGANTSFPEFLVGLDMDYMGSKMMGSNAHEYDYYETKKLIRQRIKQLRRQRKISREEADEECEIADDIECESSYYDWVSETKLLDICELDPWDLLVHVVNRQWRAFWEKLWVPLFVPELKKLAQECAARLEFERRECDEMRRLSEKWRVGENARKAAWKLSRESDGAETT